MVTVKKGNVLLDIKDEAVERMLDMGYDVLDEFGNVKVASVPKDVTALTKAYRDHVAEIAKLKAQIEELKSKKVEKPNVVNEVAEEVAVKKTTKKK